MTPDRITELAKQAGAARFYPDRQAVTPDSYLVGQEFLQRFAELVRNDVLDEAAELADEHKHSCYEGDIDWSKTMTCNERVPQANMEQPAVELCGYDETTGNCTMNPCCRDAPQAQQPAVEPVVDAAALSPKNDPLGMRAAYTHAAIAAARDRQHRYTNEYYTQCRGTNCKATAADQRHSDECRQEHDIATTPQPQQPNEADDLLRNLGLDPETYRTDGGSINHLKVKAAILNPSEYPHLKQPRPVTPYTCPKCHALWLHWPAEQTGTSEDTLNCRSAKWCDYCEKGGVEQLRRLERVPAVLTAPQPQPLVVEPVAEVLECGNLYAKVKLLGDAWGSTSVGDKFYAAPQPQPPVKGSLTTEEISDLAMQAGAYDEQLLAFARAVEAAVWAKMGVKK